MKKNIFSVIFVNFVYFFMAILAWNYIIVKLLGDDFGIGLFMIVYIGLILIYYLVIILHELGHLLFGLMSGYKFASFRIFSFMVVNINDRLRIRKFSLAGTGGQCIMIPPKKENPPFVLYNLGGLLMNLLFIGLSILLYYMYDNLYLRTFLFAFGMFNIATLLTNGIPLDVGGIPNDMKNIIEFKKNKSSYKQFVNSLYMQELIANGVRCKNIDKEYIFKPKKIESVGDVNNIVNYCDKLMDEHKFDKVIDEINDVIDNKYLLTIYKALLLNNLKYCYIVLDKDLKDIKIDNQCNDILKKMKEYPSVLRTDYAYALLIEKDSDKANRLLKKFNRLEKTYPYIGEYISEKELVDVVMKKKNVTK